MANEHAVKAPHVFHGTALAGEDEDAPHKGEDETSYSSQTIWVKGEDDNSFDVEDNAGCTSSPTPTVHAEDTGGDSLIPRSNAGEGGDDSPTPCSTAGGGGGDDGNEGNAKDDGSPTPRRNAGGRGDVFTMSHSNAGEGGDDSPTPRSTAGGGGDGDGNKGDNVDAGSSAPRRNIGGEAPT